MSTGMPYNPAEHARTLRLLIEDLLAEQRRHAGIDRGCTQRQHTLARCLAGLCAQEIKRLKAELERLDQQQIARTAAVEAAARKPVATSTGSDRFAQEYFNAPTAAAAGLIADDAGTASDWPGDAEDLAAHAEQQARLPRESATRLHPLDPVALEPAIHAAGSGDRGHG